MPIRRVQWLFVVTAGIAKRNGVVSGRMRAEENISTAAKWTWNIILIVVVIAISGVLLAIIEEAKGGRGSGSRLEGDHHEVRNLKTAIALYKLEYGKYPFDKSTEVGEIQKEIAGDLLLALTGDYAHPLNPRQKKFYEGRDVDDPEGGLWMDPASGELHLYDSYGRTYRIVLDVDYNKEIADPNNPAAPNIRQDVLVWSLGLNPEDPADDVRSW